ncbi:MAG: hypothetical protein H7329_05335, partial [Opitutaceae bacterium]|nr:hypothetical protein [Cytophagales bacterium]
MEEVYNQIVTHSATVATTAAQLLAAYKTLNSQVAEKIFNTVSKFSGILLKPWLDGRQATSDAKTLVTMANAEGEKMKILAKSSAEADIITETVRSD